MCKVIFVLIGLDDEGVFCVFIFKLIATTTTSTVLSKLTSLSSTAFADAKNAEEFAGQLQQITITFRARTSIASMSLSSANATTEKHAILLPELSDLSQSE
jgi:hypothetical protein